MQTSRILLGALAAPLVLLPACGGHDTSVADPPVAPSSSPAPTDPPQRESPEHFIRRFYATEKEMENSGQTHAYRRMTASCKPCTGLVAQVRSIYSNGGFINWGGLTIESISSPGSGHTYTVEYDARPTRFMESASSPVKSLPGGKSTDLLTLEKSASGWTVVSRARTSS